MRTSIHRIQVLAFTLASLTTTGIALGTPYDLTIQVHVTDAAGLSIPNAWVEWYAPDVPPAPGSSGVGPTDAAGWYSFCPYYGSGYVYFIAAGARNYTRAGRYLVFLMPGVDSVSVALDPVDGTPTIEFQAVQAFTTSTVPVVGTFSVQMNDPDSFSGMSTASPSCTVSEPSKASVSSPVGAFPGTVVFAYMINEFGVYYFTCTCQDEWGDTGSGTLRIVVNQTGETVVQGTVTDAGTGLPIQGAKVRVGNPAMGTGDEMLTDASGFYRLTGVAVELESYDTLSVTASGYAGQTHTISVAPASVNTFDLTLTSSAINQCPMADACSDQSVTVGSVVQLDASCSSDPDGDPLTYSWSLIERPPGSSATLDNAAAFLTTFTADAPGTYLAQLIASDGVCDSVDTVSVEVAPGTACEPVVYLGLDEESGTMAHDLSGNGHNGMLIGNPQWVDLADRVKVALLAQWHADRQSAVGGQL